MTKEKFESKNDLLVTGATSPTGGRWVKVEKGQDVAWVPYPEFRNNGSAAHDWLARNNVVIIGRGAWSQLMHLVAALDEFPAMPLIDRTGWSGGSFALPSGEVFSPDDGVPPVVLFSPEPTKCAAFGTLEGWKSEVAASLAGHHVASFVVMLAFAAPLLELTTRTDNFGFELVGPRGKGKSTLQQVASSAIGGGLESPAGRFWITFDTTLSGLERAMRVHSDLPMIIEELNLFGAEDSRRVRANKVKALVFKLANGQEKTRLNQPDADNFRFIYLTSANESLADVLEGGSPDVVRAAADRLITIPIAADRPYGVFDYLPKGFAGSREFAAALVEGMGKHHGVAFREFIEKLVASRASNEERVRRRIHDHLLEFRAQVGVGVNDGSAGRVADAFGLVYAAGSLAVHNGVLPATFDCLGASVACYQLSRGIGEPAPSFADRLAGIAAGPGIVDLGHVPYARITDKEFEAATAFMRFNRAGERELLISRTAFRRAFRDHEAIVADPAFSKLLKLDKEGRHLVKRPIRSERRDAVYCFILPGSK